MAREVTVNLGGAERRLMYDAARAAIEIEKRFGKPPVKVIDDQLAPPGELQHFSATALVFLLWIGVRHEKKRISEDDVAGWCSEAFREGEGFALCLKVKDAMLLSGVCGWSVDSEAPVKAKDDEPEDGVGEAGKGGGAVRPSESP